MTIGAVGVEVDPQVDPVDPKVVKDIDPGKLENELKAAGLPVLSVSKDFDGIEGNTVVNWLPGTEHTDELFKLRDEIIAAHNPRDLVKEQRDATLDAARKAISGLTLDPAKPVPEDMAKFVIFLLAEYRARTNQ